MRKIISLFQRNYDGDRLVRDEVVPGAEWVQAGEGVATRKLDGTCCLVRGGKLFKRYEARYRNPPGAGHPQTQPGAVFVVVSRPPDFEPASEVDPVTLKQQGWVPVGDGPEDKWHREAWAELVERGDAADGTYELIGPKVQGNPERRDRHVLVAHPNCWLLLTQEPPRDFDGLRAYLAAHGIEGIVWHHPDGRMVKIKAKDFGIKRGVAAQGVTEHPLHSKAMAAMFARE